MTPEGKVKKEVKKYLASIGAYFFMPVQTGYGATSVDFLCCIRGRFVAIETKAPGNMPKVGKVDRQRGVVDDVNAAGGIAFYADSVERVKKYIEDHVLDGYEPEKC